MRRITILMFAACVLASCANNGSEPAIPAAPKPKVTFEAGWPDLKAPANPMYICNGDIQVGVDMDRGGGIFHFSTKNRPQNLLNRYDEGRFIQQSYYGDADGSTWSGQAWSWNPVQGGSWNGVKGEVLSTSTASETLNISSKPILWSTGVPADDCVMRELIKLNGQVASITFSLMYSGTKTHKARHQELPAVFVDWDLATFVCYNGKKPWTDDPELVSYVPANLEVKGNSYQDYTEGWAAFIGPDGQGIGVYSPETSQCTLYRYGQGPGGPASPSCSYFAPIKTMSITAGFSWSYKVYLTYGTVDEIRSRFKMIHAQGK